MCNVSAAAVRPRHLHRVSLEARRHHVRYVARAAVAARFLCIVIHAETNPRA